MSSRRPARSEKLLHVLVTMGASLTGAMANHCGSDTSTGGVDTNAARDAAAESGDYGPISDYGRISVKSNDGGYAKISPPLPHDAGYGKISIDAAAAPPDAAPDGYGNISPDDPDAG